MCTGHPHAALTWFKRYFAGHLGFLLDRWSSEKFQVRKRVQLPHCNSSAKVLEQAKQEALQAMVISQLGNHHGIPHLFGVCTGKAEFYKFYIFYSANGQTIMTPTESLKKCHIKEPFDRVSVVRNIGEMLTFIYSQGYIHNVHKGNNVLLTRSPSGSLRPIIVFRTSKKIASARLPKPNVDFAKASNNVRHVAPAIQWRPSIASEGLGVLIPMFKAVDNSSK